MRQEKKPGRAFASDNWAGVHPEVLAAMAAANVGHVPSYGDDPYTHEAVARIRAELGEDAEVFLVFSGTAANVLCLGSMVRPHQAVLRALARAQGSVRRKAVALWRSRSRPLRGLQ